MATTQTPRQRANNFLLAHARNFQLPEAQFLELRTRLTQTIKEAQSETLDAVRQNAGQYADENSKLTLFALENVCNELRSDLNL